MSGCVYMCVSESEICECVRVVCSVHPLTQKCSSVPCTSSIGQQTVQYPQSRIQGNRQRTHD